ncbi:MAG: ABC transporter permease subunit [Desulfurococcus sp.]|uniref:PstA family ABC transporter permease n=1 Tax=Desulfurococcus sp. TaxID=51678 RepID=UPI003161BF7F
MARDARRVINILVIIVIIFLSGLGVLPLLWLLYSTVLNGLPPLIMKGLSFITGLPGTPMGTDIGGVAPALMGTLISSTMATLMAVALAVFSSMFTREYPYSLVSGFIETVIRAFNGIPTIIISMFIYSIIVVRMGRPSILAGSLALFIAVLPTAHYYLSSAFRSVEEKYREAAFSLGFKRAHVLRYVYLGIARRQVASGILMTFIRSVGETAPLLFTIGFLTNSVFQGIDQPGNAVSLLIFNYALSPYSNYHMVAWGASLLLLLLILIPVLFIEWFVKEVKK